MAGLHMHQWQPLRLGREKDSERESKYGFAAFSWADEAEKEEEAQAQPHQIQKQKTNPFGSARPREVVLHERGIDWRKLDQDLIPLSNIRNKAQSEKSCKENIPAPAAHVFDIIQSDPPSRSLEQKLVGTRFISKRREVPWVPLAHQNQIPLIVSPPLRYLPKNLIPGLLEESSICCNPCGLDNWQQHFQCKNRLGKEKENARNKQRLQKVHSLDPRSHIHPQLDQNIIWRNSQSSEFKNNVIESQNLVLQREAQHSGKNLRKSAACMNQQEMRMFNTQNLVGTPLVNERRAPFLEKINGVHWLVRENGSIYKMTVQEVIVVFPAGEIITVEQKGLSPKNLSGKLGDLTMKAQKLLGMSL